MKKLLSLCLLTASAIFAGAQANCSEDGAPGQWVWASICPPGHGVISFYVCATSGSCPGSAWCPGNNGCAVPVKIPLVSNPALISRLSKDQVIRVVDALNRRELDSLTAKIYVKKPVELTIDELRKFTPPVLTAHGATGPPCPDDDGDGGTCHERPRCSTCAWWDVVCLFTCINAKPKLDLPTNEQLKSLETLLATRYQKPVRFPRILLAHGATAPPDPYDDGNRDPSGPKCGTCEWYDLICKLICIP